MRGIAAAEPGAALRAASWTRGRGVVMMPLPRRRGRRTPRTRGAPLVEAASAAASLTQYWPARPSPSALAPSKPFGPAVHAAAAASSSSSSRPNDEKQNSHAPSSSLLDVFTVTGLTPAEAVTGADRTVEFSARRACDECGGRGVSASQLERAAKCRACGGRGRVALRRWAAADGGDALIRPARAMMGPCPACAGAGLAAAPPPCPGCGGGRLECGGAPAPQRLRLRVPAGVEDGQVLRVRGQGHDAPLVDGGDDCGAAAGWLQRGGDSESDDEQDGGEQEEKPPPPPPPPDRRYYQSGDLYVRLDVRVPAGGGKGAGSFSRVPGTDDIASELRLCLLDALLGAEVGVTTALGETRLRVPAGTQHGARLALRGHGVPRAGTAGGGKGAGDHVFKVVVVVPRPGELFVSEEDDGGCGEEEEPPLLRGLRAAAADGEAGRRARRRRATRQA